MNNKIKEVDNSQSAVICLLLFALMGAMYFFQKEKRPISPPPSPSSEGVPVLNNSPPPSPSSERVPVLNNKRLAFIAMLALLVWGVSFVVFSKFLSDEAGKWWNMVCTSLEALGITTKASDSWCWSSPFASVNDIRWRVCIMICIIGSIVIILQKHDTFGIFALCTYVVYSHWKSLLQLFLCFCPIFFIKYWCYIPFTTWRNEIYHALIVIMSFFGVIGVRMYAKIEA